MGRMPTVPELSLDPADVTSDPAETIVVLAVSTAEGPPRLLGLEGSALAAVITPKLAARAGASGAADSLARIPVTLGGADRTVAVAGAGARPEPAALRRAAGSAVRQLAGADRVAIQAPGDEPAQLAAILEGAALGAYSFTTFRGRSAAKQKRPVAAVSVHGAAADPALVARASTLAEAVATVKDLVNTPASELYPESFARRARELGEGLGLEYEVWDEQALARDGFGGILGVGRGSQRPPRLVRVRYAPERASRHLAFVGKGITFDSGGLSLKPPASMIGMKYDMTGAATALAVVIAAARLRLPVRATAWLCLAENMPSGSATRPGDVLVIRGGTTVEVLNTDAEGRLVLADGLVAASEEQPDAIVDVATLTGAASVALGKRTVGIMGEPELLERLRAAGEDAGELLWPMPLTEELRPMLDSSVADIANVKPGNTAAGMLLAAVFLREFVGTARAGGAGGADAEDRAEAQTGAEDDARRIPWAHLDVAGPAYNDGGAWGFTGPGSTGVAVRALIRFLERSTD